MAIEIVKEGCKKFNITCPNCGCEFTYEYEDVSIGTVTCPCCEAHLPHKGVVGKVDECPLPTNGEYGTTINPNGTFPMPIWYNQQVAPNGYKIRGGLNQSDNPCDNCPNNPKYLKTPYIGDSPCQWCQKNPNKITCTSGGSNVY